MKINKINENIAVITSNEKVIIDAQSALDLAMTVKYETECTMIAIDKKIIADDFFILSSGMAGEILQKFINYHFKMAIWGDYSKYISKTLKDFIHESNKGNDFFFAGTKEQAIEKLTLTKG
ncbi:MAG: DUF4180 domain-containing protein [Aminipila sp.]